MTGRSESCLCQGARWSWGERKGFSLSSVLLFRVTVAVAALSCPPVRGWSGPPWSRALKVCCSADARASGQRRLPCICAHPTPELGLNLVLSSGQSPPPPLLLVSAHPFSRGSPMSSGGPLVSVTSEPHFDQWGPASGPWRLGSSLRLLPEVTQIIWPSGHPMLSLCWASPLAPSSVSTRLGWLCFCLLPTTYRPASGTIPPGSLLTYPKGDMAVLSSRGEGCLGPWCQSMSHYQTAVGRLPVPPLLPNPAVDRQDSIWVAGAGPHLGLETHCVSVFVFQYSGGTCSWAGIL